jgi:hypothetical protein
VRKFREGNLEITFDETWRCEKWDECAAFAQGIKKLQGTRAIDFLGIRNDKIYLIEIKDFREHRIENKDRQPIKLPEEIAFKVRDTIAGVVGASIMKTGDTLTRECTEILGHTNDTSRVRVIAWILEDKIRPAKGHMHAATRRKQLEAQLRWLTTKVREGNPLVNPMVEGVVVENLKKE